MSARRAPARPVALAVVWMGSIVLMAVVQTGCAHAPPPDTGALEATRGPECITLSRVREYQLLDSRNLVVFAPDRANAFHVVLATPCPGLRLGAGLRLHGDRGRLCGFPGERVASSLPGLDTGRERESGCRVSAVRALDPAGLQELLVRFGRGEEGEPAAGEAVQQMP